MRGFNFVPIRSDPMLIFLSGNRPLGTSYRGWRALYLLLLLGPWLYRYHLCQKDLYSPRLGFFVCTVCSLVSVLLCQNNSNPSASFIKKSELIAIGEAQTVEFEWKSHQIFTKVCLAFLNCKNGLNCFFKFAPKVLFSCFIVLALP